MSIVNKFRLLARHSDECGFKKLHDLSFFFLQLAQLNVFCDQFDNGRWNQLRNISAGIFPFLNLIFSLYAAFSYRHDIDELSLGINSTLVVTQMFCKVIDLFVHRKAHRELIETVQRDTESLKNDPIYRDMGITHFNKARKIMLLYAFTLTMSLIGMILAPLIILIARNQLTLAVNIEIFFTNHTEPVGWIINFLYGIVYASQTAFYLIGYDSIFYNYVIYIELRFKMLEHMLSKIGDFNGNYDRDDKHHVLIVNCYRLHAEIIE